MSDIFNISEEIKSKEKENILLKQEYYMYKALLEKSNKMHSPVTVQSPLYHGSSTKKTLNFHTPREQRKSQKSTNAVYSVSPFRETKQNKTKKSLTVKSDHFPIEGLCRGPIVSKFMSNDTPLNKQTPVQTPNLNREITWENLTTRLEEKEYDERVQDLQELTNNLQHSLKVKEKEKWDLKDFYEKELQMKSTAYEQNIAELTKAHQEEVKRLKADFKEQIKLLNAKIDQINNENTQNENFNLQCNKNFGDIKSLQSNFEGFMKKSRSDISKFKQERDKYQDKCIQLAHVVENLKCEILKQDDLLKQAKFYLRDAGANENEDNNTKIEQEVSPGISKEALKRLQYNFPRQVKSQTENFKYQTEKEIKEVLKTSDIVNYYQLNSSLDTPTKTASSIEKQIRSNFLETHRDRAFSTSHNHQTLLKQASIPSRSTFHRNSNFNGKNISLAPSKTTYLFHNEFPENNQQARDHL